MKKERLAGTLSRHNHPVENFLQEAGFDGATIRHAMPWCNRLEADARRWMQRGGWAADRGRITKVDAHRLFSHAFRQGGAR